MLNNLVVTNNYFNKLNSQMIPVHNSFKNRQDNLFNIGTLPFTKKYENLNTKLYDFEIEKKKNKTYVILKIKIDYLEYLVINNKKIPDEVVLIKKLKEIIINEKTLTIEYSNTFQQKIMIVENKLVNNRSELWGNNELIINNISYSLINNSFINKSQLPNKVFRKSLNEIIIKNRLIILDILDIDLIEIINNKFDDMVIIYKSDFDYNIIKNKFSKCIKIDDFLKSENVFTKKQKSITYLVLNILSPKSDETIIQSQLNTLNYFQNSHNYNYIFIKHQFSSLKIKKQYNIKRKYIETSNFFKKIYNSHKNSEIESTSSILNLINCYKPLLYFNSYESINNKNANECVICRKNKEDLITKCEHYFCYECAIGLFKKKQTIDCPFCRTLLHNSDIFLLSNNMNLLNNYFKNNPVFSLLNIGIKNIHLIKNFNKISKTKNQNYILHNNENWANILKKINTTGLDNINYLNILDISHNNKELFNDKINKSLNKSLNKNNNNQQKINIYILDNSIYNNNSFYNWLNVFKNLKLIYKEKICVVYFQFLCKNTIDEKIFNEEVLFY
jgi:hypothetical protein